MGDTELTVSVEGQAPELLVQPFLDAVSNTLDILGDLDIAISLRGRRTIRWSIGSLHYGRPTVITMQARPPASGRDVGPDVVRHYIDGLETLARGQELPAYFSEDALQAAKRLADLARDDARTITIRSDSRSFQVTQRISVNVDELINRFHVAEGSLEGVIEVVTLHEHTYFRIYDAIHGWGIPCYFGSDLLNEVREALGKRVSVSGLLRSDRLGKPETMRVRSIRLFVDDEELPSVQQIRGIAKGMTGGKLAEDYLRELRSDVGRQ